MAEIFPGSSDDLDEIVTLHGRSFETPWDLKAFGELLGMSGTFLQVAREAPASSIMGFILTRIAADEAEIITIAVDPAYRGQGVGAALVTSAAAEAKAFGATSLILEVAEDNAAAIHLYERLGFVVMGRRTAYYERKGGRVAAHIMALALGRA